MQLEEIQKMLRERRRKKRPGKLLSGDAAAIVRVALGADHGGFALKERLKPYLEDLGYEVEDVGTRDERSVDYPDYAVAVGRAVASGTSQFGITIDGAGIGSCMVANKIAGIRAANCHDGFTVRNSREHNDANVLVLGSNVVQVGLSRRLVRLWLSTPHAGGRHARRVEKINSLDRRQSGDAEEEFL